MLDVGPHSVPFQWTDRDRTGIRLLDRDHMMVVQQAQILAAALDRDDRASADSTIRFIRDFLPRMFEREDRLMANSTHQERGAHQDSHRALLKKIRGQAQVSDAADTLEIGRHLLTVLADWRTRHIPTYDTALADHLRASDLKPFETNGAPRLSGTVEWSRLSILVVDGQFAFRGTARAMLKDFGVQEIRDARDGVDALKSLHERPADIVLVDQHMAPMDGADFTRKLRHTTGSPCPRAVVILMTGEDVTQGFINRALDSGIHDLLKKPLSQDALKSRLERHVLSPLPFRETGRLILPVHPDKAPLFNMR